SNFRGRPSTRPASPKPMLRKYEFHFPLPTLSQQTISEVLTIAGRTMAKVVWKHGRNKGAEAGLGKICLRGSCQPPSGKAAKKSQWHEGQEQNRRRPLGRLARETP